MLQWRCKKSEPHPGCEAKHWRNHHAIDKQGAAELVMDMNDHSPCFEYRIRKDKNENTG